MEIKIPELERITGLLEDIKGLLQHMNTPFVCAASEESVTALLNGTAGSLHAPKAYYAEPSSPEPAAEVAEPIIPTAAPAQPEMPPLPTAAPTVKFSLKDLANACRPLIDGGKREDIKNIISAMGFTQLSDVPAERYEEFAAAIRELGAVI